MGDTDLIEELRKGNTSALKHCYDYLSMVSAYVTKNSGTIEDAQDTFQDALVVFYKNAISPQFTLKAKVSTYIFAICRKMWLNKLRSDRLEITSEVLSEAYMHQIEAFDFELYDRESNKFVELMKILDGIGRNCKDIIKMFYFSKLSLEEIASKMEYSSEQMARQQKYRCMKRIRKLMDELPHKRDFLNG